MKKLLLVAACLLLITGCKNVKLENGENAIVTFKDGALSSQDLYEELKAQYGDSVISDLIDSYLLNKKYETTDEEKNYIKQTIKSLKENAKSANTTLENYISSYYNINSVDTLEKVLSLNYKRNLWIYDYAKETVTERQINDYYENYVYGDIEASQILITIDAKDSDSDEEKEKAENKALETANSIIKELKSGKDFSELAKKYSKDQNSASNGGALGKVNDGDLTDEALEALRNLKDGSYTTTPVKSSYGYHILFRTSMDTKSELTDELKETIISKIASEIAVESGFSSKAIAALHEKNEMKFIDTDLEKQFNKSN